MATSLSTKTSSGSQTVTQSPQTSATENNGAARAGTVQPGTATNLLNSDRSGVSLKGQPLSIVTLGARHTQISQFAPPAKQHLSPLLFGVSGLLFVVAVALFWATARSAKNTT